ncbi:hypothetical protein [Streptomyces nodosus]|uniref:hypothetical protein n=1 Tax=Streptomyces nodosus TaxID=40318 RepID=UPI00382D7F10
MITRRPCLPPFQPGPRTPQSRQLPESASRRTHRLNDAALDVLAPLCEEIGKTLEHGLAARRYAISGDRRALHGTVL